AVAVNGRPGDGQVAAVSRSIRDDGGAAEGFCADVTDEHQVAGLVTAIADCFGPVDVLVLNATGPQPEAAVTDVTWADHLAQLDFFVKSPVLLGRAVLPGMQARRYGRIVQIDSEVAHRPPPGRSAYATAKSAQIGLARSSARLARSSTMLRWGRCVPLYNFGSMVKAPDFGPTITSTSSAPSSGSDSGEICMPPP